VADETTAFCDLVMKGGITSGIVYPPALLELHKQYTFKNIGGTSAGAIGAAAAAAAQYGGNEGFKRLDEVSTLLNENKHLFDLFQPTPAMQPWFDVLEAWLQVHAKTSQTPGGNNAIATSQGDKPARTPLFLRLLTGVIKGLPTSALPIASAVCDKWTRSYKPFQQGGRQGMLQGLAAGLLLALPSACVVSDIVSLFARSPESESRRSFLRSLILLDIVLGAGGAWLGLWLGRCIGVLNDFKDIAAQRLAKNAYGICSGHQDVSDDENDNTYLADWLSSVIDQMAGFPPRTAPLTFGQLRDKDINLKMVTTNLSQRQPYVIPQDMRNFLFKESDMRRLFPAYVVQHMIKSSPIQPLIPTDKLPPEYYFLPDPDNLPVVVGTRLSLSFPILLSAVPLYTISSSAYGEYRHSQRALQKEDLQCNWFSDGGICSNFPIQFFDAWLPTQPTFGINLTSTPTATSAMDSQLSSQHSAREECSDVYLPRATDRQEPEWLEITQPLDFLSTILNTACSYRDTLQTQLPAYRERIVQIRLDKQEGGMNLTMAPDTIEKVRQKGEKAGQILRNRFDFEQHWWVRFLVLTSQLDEHIKDLRGMFDNTSNPTFDERLQKEWLSDTCLHSKYPYYHDEEWCKEAGKRIAALQTLINAWQCMQGGGNPDLFQDHAPLPRPVLRVTPEV